MVFIFYFTVNKCKGNECRLGNKAFYCHRRISKPAKTETLYIVCNIIKCPFQVFYLFSEISSLLNILPVDHKS